MPFISKRRICQLASILGSWLVVSSLVFVPLAKSSSDQAQQEFFESKVRPLLAKNCFSCHTDAKMGGLQLDTREHLLKGGNSGPVVVPGDPDKSLLIKAINHTDTRLEMPPPGKLTSEEISILETWVRDGAVWGLPTNSSIANVSKEYAITSEQRAFWSFQPVRKPLQPNVQNSAWIKTPIDAFILTKLETKGLVPVGPADKATLIRRATLDLTGLPPTPAEVEGFVQDPSPNAFEKVVDRLLASPHYGERWGRYWLDIARYSDDQLNATEDVPVPNAFRYRDWVVEALNNDMPYDQFITAQIAGDQMPNPEKFVGGLGFYALSPNPEFHEDRVDATGRGFLGLTVACAQCHNHKYDPIPTKDYYSLLGVFASTEANEFPLASPDVVNDHKKQKKQLDEDKAALTKFLDTQRSLLVEIFAEKAAPYMEASWLVLGPSKKTVDEVAKDGRLDREVLARWVRFLQAGNKHEYGFLDGWLQLLENPKGSEAEVQRVAEEFQNKILAAQREKEIVDEKNTKSASRAKKGETPEVFPLQRETYYLLQDISAAPTADVGKKFVGGVLYFSNAEIPRFLSGIWREHFDILQAKVDKSQAALPPQYPFLVTIKDKAEPENLHVYIRGDKENPGEEAPRRFLAILSEGAPPAFKSGSGRLELAKCIASPSNPLTARVMVNRIWQYHFGEGLVRTPSNFGKLGERPSHPELLDYLAACFVENGWSIKKMHREIMLSATYALSSQYSESNFNVDPDNRLLWRSSIRRLDVESIRDSLLFVSGRLDEKIGGPAISVEDDKNVQRTIYSSVSRRKLDPFLRLFDFPDPNQTSEQRIVTNVPLQQLFFLNSDFVHKAAEAVLHRINPELPADEKIRKLYLILYSRFPNPEELRCGIDYVSAGGNFWISYVQVLLSSNEFYYLG